MCSGGDTGPTSDAGQRAVDQHTGRSTGWLRGSFGGERTNGSKHKKGGSMCGNTPKRPPRTGEESSDPMHLRMKREGRRLRGDFPPPQPPKRPPDPPRDGQFWFAPLLLATMLACGGGKSPSERDRRDMPHRAPARDKRPPNLFPFAVLLGLVSLACGSKGPGGGDTGSDDLRKAYDEEGDALRKLLGPNPPRRRHRFAGFTLDAVDILTGPEQGGRYLAARDYRGWVRYVFLDDSVERHPFNCRYVRMLRAVRGVGRIGGVA